MNETNQQDVTYGWYGKSPAAGDFVSRRLPRAAIAVLDGWFQSGMTALRDRAPVEWPTYYANAPVWRALLPSQIVVPQPCLAIVAASSDRVGRRFPFCIVAPLSPQSNGWMRSVAQGGDELSRLVEQSLRMPLHGDEIDRRLDEIASRVRDESGARDSDDMGNVLDDLAIESGDELATVPLTAQSTFPWPDLAQRFEPAGTASYWWASAKRASAGFVHRGALDAELFVTLFGEARRPK